MARGNETKIVVTSQDKTDFSAPKRKAEAFSKDTVDAAKKAGKQIQDETKQALTKVAAEYEKTGKKVKDSISDGAEKGGKQAADDMDTSSQRGGRAFLTNIKGFLKHAGNEFKEFGNQAKQNASEIGEKAKGVGGKMAGVGKVLGAALAGGVLAATAIVGTKLVDAMNLEVANDRLVGQLDLSTEAAKRAGRAAANIYAGNWGESITDVNEAIKTVGNNLLDVNKVGQKELEKTTTRALALRDAFGVELTKSTNAASVMIKNGLAKNSEEAFDIITKGFQMGNDRAEDWLDTLSEYSPQFLKLGIDGEYATNLISAALKNGARNSDIAADAIKEFSIRSIDGSKLTQEGFKAAGLDAGKMAKEIGKGGPAAQKAFQQTLQALASIKDPVKQEMAGVALFGTQWEDLGPKAATAMATAKTGVDGLQGSTDKLANTMGDNLAGRIASLKRAGEVWANSKLLPFVEQLSDRFDKDFKPALDSIKSAFALILPVAKEFGEKILGALKANISGITDAFRDNRPQLEAFASFIASDLAPVVGTILVTSLRAAGLAIEYIIRGIGFAVDAFLWLKENIAKVAADGTEIWKNFVTGVFIAIGMLLESFRGYAKGADAVFGTKTEEALDSAIQGFDEYSKSVQRSLDGTITDLRRYQREAASERNLIKLKANKQDIEAKIADVKRKLRDPKLTNPQRSKLRADASRLRADLIAAQAAINRLRGKTVTLRTNREIYTYRFDSTQARRGSQSGMEHGGITGSHAQEGGPRNGLTLVGEGGPELVKLPPGSMVHSNPDSQRIAAGEPGRWNKGGGDIHMTLMIGSDRIGQLLIRPLRNEVVALGGNVQAVLGKG